MIRADGSSESISFCTACINGRMNRASDVTPTTPWLHLQRGGEIYSQETTYASPLLSGRALPDGPLVQAQPVPAVT